MSLLSLLFLLLTDLFLQIGKESSKWLTELSLQIDGVLLTEFLLRIDNALRDLGRALGQWVPMSCHFWGSLSI